MDGKNSTLKLCGFDESYYENKAQKTSNIGTIHYRAPEIILGHSAGHSIDVWSSALVLYEMATNQKLFPATTNNEVLYQHMRTFGAAPWSMVKESAFKNAHYVGQDFLRRHFCKENNTVSLSDTYLTFILCLSFGCKSTNPTIWRTVILFVVSTSRLRIWLRIDSPFVIILRHRPKAKKYSSAEIQNVGGAHLT